jgi:hypothetical protein
MVWSGEWDGALYVYSAPWRGQASWVSWSGVMPKPEVYAVLRRGEVAMIPSRVDSFPNAAIKGFEMPWRARQFSPPAIIDQMEPRIAAMNVVWLAGHPQ